jgi:Glycosyltransferase family 87
VGSIRIEPRWGDTPTWFLCFEPLTFFSPFTAYWVWFCLNAFFFAASIWILIRDVGLKRAEAWIVGVLMLMYPPVATNFWFAQSEVALLFILVVFIHELERGREVTSGLILAAASLLRAYPLGLLGYLVARRKWRAVAFTLLGCVAGLAITFIFAGPDVVITYLRSMGFTHGLGLWGSTHPLNQPLGLLRHPANLNAMWFVKFGLVHAFGIGETSATAAVCGFLGELALVAIVFIQTVRFAADEDREYRAFSMWIITVSILSPIMWPQFMACFVIVFVALAGAATRNHVSKRALWTAVASYLLVSVLGKMHGYPFDWAEMVELRLSAMHPHVVHVMAEATTGSLILLFLSAYWFMCDIAGTPQAKVTGYGDDSNVPGLIVWGPTNQILL